MKRLLLILLLINIYANVLGQYVPNSGQAFQFASVYNPAFVGVEPYGDLKLGYRYQWTGFKENAPKFVNLSYNMRLKQPLDLTLNSLRTSQSGNRYSIPKRKQMFQGLGLNVYNESIGPISRTGGGVNYAVHYPLTDKLHLSGGVAAIVENTKLDMDKIYLGVDAQPDPLVEELKSAGSDHTEVGIRAGILVFSDQFYFGASYFPVWKTAIKSSALEAPESFYKGSVQAGAAFALPDQNFIKPSIMALWLLNNEISVDYNAKFYLQNKAWFGLTYRDIQAGIVSAGLNVTDLFAASYSYEFSMGKVKEFSGGSHELVLSLRLNNFKKVNQRTW